jgi:hypothetical protein
MEELLRDYLHTEIVINAFNELVSIDDMDNEIIIASNAKYFIQGYFEGRRVVSPSSDWDPQKETMIRVSGAEYVKYVFANDYDLALVEIIGEIERWRSL